MNRDDHLAAIKAKVEEHARIDRDLVEYTARARASMDALIAEIAELQGAGSKSAQSGRPRSAPKKSSKIPKPGTVGRRILESLYLAGGHASHEEVARRANELEPMEKPVTVTMVRSTMAGFKPRGFVMAGDRDGWTRIVNWVAKEIERGGTLLPALSNVRLDSAVTSDHPGH